MFFFFFQIFRFYSFSSSWILWFAKKTHFWSENKYSKEKQGSNLLILLTFWKFENKIVWGKLCSKIYSFDSRNCCLSMSNTYDCIQNYVIFTNLDRYWDKPYGVWNCICSLLVVISPILELNRGFICVEITLVMGDRIDC